MYDALCETCGFQCPKCEQAIFRADEEILKGAISMTDLGDKMRGLASSGHERAAELVEKADAFDVAAAGYYGDPQTCDVRKFLGCYARARRLWCDITGEPLV